MELHETSGRPKLWGNMAFIVIAMAPTLMIAAREIPATLAVVVTLFLMMAVMLDGNLSAVTHDVSRLVRSWGGMAAIGLVSLAVASTLWSPIPDRGLAHVGYFGGGLILAALSACALRHTRPTFSTRLLAAGMILAAVLVITDLTMDSALRMRLGLATDDYRLNRAVVAIALFLPLVSVLYVAERRIMGLMAIWAVCAAAIVISVSYSAKLALIIVIMVLPLSWQFPLFVHRCIGFAAILTILAMPLIAPAANALIPERVHTAVGYYSLTIRGEMWAETALFIAKKPVFGWGIEASHVLSELPEASVLDEHQRSLLSWGHTHNAPLQLWLELGGVGAVIAAVGIAAAMIAMERLPRPLLPAASTTFAAAFAISCISHGAWQAWWWGWGALLIALFAIAVAASDTGGRPSKFRQ